MLVDLNKCDPACTACVLSYVKKHNLKAGQGGKWEIPCTGIPKEYISKEVLSTLNIPPEIALSMVDPVQWAATFLDIHCLDPIGDTWKKKTLEGRLGTIRPYNEEEALRGKSPFHRPYQSLLLRCSSQYKVFRIGRQCISDREYIYTSNGPIQVNKLQENDSILGGNCHNLTSFEDDIFQISFSNGSSLKVNKEHPFYTQDGWKKLSELTKKDYVQFLPATDFQLTALDNLTVKEIRLLGYLLSDGYFAPKQSVKFTNTNPIFLNEVIELTKDLFPEIVPKWYKKSNGHDLLLTTKHGSQYSPLISFLKKSQVYKKDSFGIILQSSLPLIQEFVSTFFNGDGYIWSYKRPERKNGYRAEIGFCIGINYNKAIEFQFLLWKLGIQSCVKSEWMLKSTRPFYRVLVSQKQSLVKLLSFLDRRKYPDKFKNFETHINQIKDHKKIDFYKIKKIDYVGKDTVYGWETDSHEIISLCGMRTHNSGKSWAMGMLIDYLISVNKGYSVIFLAPYDSQAKKLAKYIVDPLENNPLTANTIKICRNSPHFYLELYNGSSVSGFTTGVKTNNKAGSARGQTGNLLVLEEADMMSQEDLESSLAITANDPNARVLMSSTPTGKRQMFWATCFNAQYKEFHYPSSCNPNWSDKTEKLYRSMYSQIAYSHELEAIFGEDEEGVYQVRYVENAQSDYEYHNMSYQPTWVYTIGVDWNDVANGTSIRVVGYNPGDRNWYVVSKENVSKQGWNQLAACQKIVEMNRLWKPNWIYVDLGFGGSQIEIIHKFGMDAMRDKTRGPNSIDARLARIVKGYDFGSMVEIFDPFTRDPVKKPAKPFCVESSVRRFETSSIKYPRSDIDLTKSLLGYRIKRIGNNGIPTYMQSDSKCGDHDLTALNLALVAFVLEISDLGHTRYNSESIISTDRLGEIPQQQKSTIFAPVQPQDNKIITRDIEVKITSGKNLYAGDNPRIWSWPGFLRGEPPPTRQIPNSNNGRMGRAMNSIVRRSKF